MQSIQSADVFLAYHYPKASKITGLKSFEHLLECEKQQFMTANFLKIGTILN